MKKLLLIIAIILGLSATANAQYRVFDSGQVGTSPVTNYYLKTDGVNSFWAAVSAGGGSGGGTFSTSTAWGSILYNFPNNLTDIVLVGYDGSGVATSSDAEFVLDPVAKLGLFLNSTKVGIGTTSPWRSLSVNGSSDLGTNALAGYFTATTSTASVFPVANITKLSNLTTNGFVKTGSSDGTLSVDTTTYESGLTAGDGLTRTVNDFDCDTANSSTFGCLSSTDWTTFNNKQSSGNYITALTGDVTASGPGSVAATLATVNSNVGSYTNANITVNAKGLITAASNGTGGTGGTGTVGTSSVPVKGNLAYWTTDTATPALLSTIATTSVTCSGSTTCTSFTAIGASPITISSSGAGITGGTANMLASWVDATNLTATGTPQAASYIATSTTATSTFAGSVMIGTAMNSGMMTPGGGIINTGQVPLQSSTNINDLTNSLATGNMSQGAYAADCHSQYNASTSPFLGLTATNYFANCFTGPNFNSATAPGGGLIYGSIIPGLPANSYVQVVQPGAMLFGALGTDITKAWMSWSIGSGYQVGNYDMILKNVDTAGSSNTASGGLGLGTTSPWARLSIAASSTATFPYLVVAQHINGAYTNASPVFMVHQNENTGIATGTPWGRLSVNPNGITGPSFVVGSSTKTNFIIDNAGRTGVGTESPTSKLFVKSDGSTTGNAFTINNSSSAQKLNILDNGQTRLSTSLSAISQDTLLELIGSAAGTGFNTETLFKLVRPSNGLEYTKVFGIGVGKGSDSSNLTSNTRVDFLVKTTASTGNDPTSVAMTIWGRPVMSPLIGIGSTTPWGQLSVNPTAGLTGPAFVIGSSTATHFMVNNNGNVGIGTTTTSNAKITIGGSTSATTTVKWGGKRQEEYYNSDGSIVCEFVNGTTKVIQSGACTY